MRLTVRSGPDEGTSIEPTSEQVLIGRGDDCDLVLHDEKVSRHHASLSILPGGGATLTDLGSSNGTLVNGSRIHGSVHLEGGEQLSLGNTVVVVRDPVKTVLAAPGPALRIESGAHRGTSVEVVGERFVIGRDETCDLVLPDKTVSARHASISLEADGTAVLADMGSRNGTFVNGCQIYEPIRLDGGERVRLGDVVVSARVSARRRAETAVAVAGAWFTVVSGAERDTTVKITGERYLIGRDESCDFVLADTKASRQHATLSILGLGRAVITDLGSSNGTFVDGARIDRPVELRGGERVRIGDTELAFGEEPLEGRETAQVLPSAPPSAPPRTPSRFSPEALARTAAARPWLTIALWLVAFLVGVGVAAVQLEDVLTAEGSIGGNPESKRADALLEDRLRGPRRLTELVVVRSPTLTVDSPAFRGEVESLHRDLVALGPGVVTGASHFYQERNPAFLSDDKHAVLVAATLAGDFDAAQSQVAKVMEVVERADRSPRFDVLATGEASVARDFEAVAERDLRKGESIGLAVAFVVLVCVFGTLVASLVPVLLAVIAIGIALGLAALVGHVIDLSIFVTNMVVGMGLALGIDYSLFVLTRYREERGRGRDVRDSIAVAGATSSRAVVFSGLAVVLALLGMSFAPDPTLRSLGIGAILVGAISVLATLTLLPACLALLGDRVNRIRVPLLGRGSDTAGAEQRFWEWAAALVMRRPVTSLVLSAALLVAAAVPVFDLATGSAGVSTLPESAVSKRGFVLIQGGFASARTSPAEIVVDGDVNSPAARSAIKRLQTRLRRDDVFGSTQLSVGARGDLALVSVPVVGDPKGPRATEAVKRLRGEYIPGAFAGVPGDVLVTGETAREIDYVKVSSRALPFVLVFVLGLSFLLLTVAFRSIVVPAKAVVMNLLSVGAAYGLLILVFQKGVGAELLGFQQVDRVEPWVPLFLFAVLFGLSMDYHVFLLSRIRERFNATGDNHEAVRYGITSTARIITGAALIMVAVFSGFALGDLVPFQQLGFGMAVALLLDATVVRTILVPAGMQLLGARNWYLPRWLRWLPEWNVEEGGEPSAAAAHPLEAKPATS